MIKTWSVQGSKLHGVGVRTRPICEVDFVCPCCGVDRAGTVVEQQRWYHVFGIPCVPLATLDEAVDCATCGHRSGVAVLEVLTANELTARLATAMRCATASMVKASIDDGDGIGVEMLDAVFDLMMVSGYEYDEIMLAGDLSAIDSDLLSSALRPLVDELTPHGKQGFLHRMVAIALADGGFTRSEQQTLVDIGVALGMAAPHINGVLATAVTHHQAAA
jgi:hypothetical protein